MERKFRAWSLEDEAFLDIYSIGFDGDGSIEYVYVFDGDSCSEPPFFKEDGLLVLNQFTGLFDDNGVDIYEGDIVEVMDDDETKTPHSSNVYNLSYHGALINSHPTHNEIDIVNKRHLHHYCDYGFGGKYNVSCRILGNIYENPELI